MQATNLLQLIISATFLLVSANALVVSRGFALRPCPLGPTSTALFAHHPQKKIIKKKMHNRPKKHRLSDINRENANLNKCITKIEGAPEAYLIVGNKDEHLAEYKAALNFWQDGDIKASWIDIKTEDMVATFPQNIVPPSDEEKKDMVPPLFKSRAGTVFRSKKVSKEYAAAN